VNMSEAKTYTGTKTLKAIPATRVEYCAYRGWEVPSDENPADAGYMVEYEPDGKPNITGHDGYVSWSPADVFERTYHEVPEAPPVPMADDWKGRLTIETTELRTRLNKLNGFIGSAEYDNLPLPDRDLLDAQSRYMTKYHDVLVRRIERAGQ
jgi:hypothetical protein